MSALSRFTLLLIIAGVFSACGGSDAPKNIYSESDPALGPPPDPSNEAGYPEGEVPPGWIIRFDQGEGYVVSADPDSADVWFVTMTPGWHITSKPAAIFYHPAASAEGDYVAVAKMHLFDPGDRNEGYGLLIGGENLSSSGQVYTYFLIRRSGEYLVKRRLGPTTQTLIGWTASDAIVPYDENTTGTSTNSLAIDVQESELCFLVNDVELACLPRQMVPSDGLVGLRLNHEVNVHVEDFGVRKPEPEPPAA